MSRGATGIWVALLLQTTFVLELSAPRVFPAVGDLRASGCGGEAHGLRARCPVPLH